MSLDFQRLEQVLAGAVAKADPLERADYLAQTCGENRELRTEVERLLSAHQQAGDFLETPVKPAAQALEGSASRRPNSLSDPELALERPGAQIGRYKLLEQIGEGGFGIVYMAEQLEPVHRQVALKIVKAGMDTREVIARFEAERQALALMDHPNIAKVFDGGIIGSPDPQPSTHSSLCTLHSPLPLGRPYFVMELVRGIPITDFCDQRQLSTSQRLQLFIQVCLAVQHAHQKGIIHRDLKPSNILVTLIDGEPVPKVIDFGVAKALGQKLTAKTLFTGFLKMVGTPAYMSPEQADLSGVDIDTRADIYALGVLLYELLTGVTPFDKETLAKAALDEIRQLIRETDPPNPSTRLSRLEEATRTTIATQRRADPAALTRLLRGELDWVVMKCLDKDRRRRYESANHLAEDIQRYLAQEPVLACPPSTAYRLRKFVRRNKVALTTTALFALVLLLGSIISVLQAIRATKAERLAAKRLEAETAARMLAENARREALAEASKATAVSELLQKTLNSLNPNSASGADGTMRQLLDDFSSSLGDQFNHNPELEASIHASIGNAYRNLGAPEKAEPHLHEALAVRRRIFGDHHESVAQTLLDLGRNSHDRKDDRVAEALTRQALTIFKDLNLTRESVLASTCLQSCLKSLGRFEEAEQLAREALLLAHTMSRPENLLTPGWPQPTSPNSEGWLDLARLWLDIQEQAADKGDPDKIRKLFKEAARLGGAKDPAEFELREWNLRGKSCLGAGQWNPAIAAFSKAIAVHRHDQYLYFHRAYCYLQIGKFQEALEDYTRSLQMDPQDPGTWALRGFAYFKLNQPEKALADYLKAIDCWHVRIERMGWIEPVGLKGRPFYWSFPRSAELVRIGADPDEVRSLYQKLHAAFRDEVAAVKKRHGTIHRETESALTVFAQFLENEGKLAEAEAVWRDVIFAERSLSGDQNLPVAAPLCSLGAALQRTGKMAEAEAAYREALAIRRKKLGSNHPDVVSCWKSLGAVLKAQGKPTEAEIVEREALGDLTNAVPRP